MSVQVVRHTSRDYDVILNFASTENNLSWSFTQEGDGEIYDVILDNVASYTIEGVAVTLPFLVTNGIYYTVSIVKTTTGQAASIAFKTRRSISKINTISIPDYGAHNGRYPLILLTDDTIHKCDSELLKDSNLTTNTYTTNPVLKSVTLPTPTLTSTEDAYQWLKTVYNPVDGMYFVLGVTRLMTSNKWGRYMAVKIDENLNIYSLSGISNSISYYTSVSNNNSFVYNAHHLSATINYIENTLLMAMHPSFGSGNFSSVKLINLINGSEICITNQPTYSYTVGQPCYIPMTNEFGSTMFYMSSSGFYAKNWAWFNNTYTRLFDRINNMFRVIPSSSTGGFDSYNYSTGYIERALTGVMSGSTHGSMMYHSNGMSSIIITRSTAASDYKYFSISPFSSSKVFPNYYKSIVNISYPEFTRVNFSAACNYSELYLLSLINGSVLSNNLIVLKTTTLFNGDASGNYEGRFDSGYLTFGAPIISIATNQIL